MKGRCGPGGKGRRGLVSPYPPAVLVVATRQEYRYFLLCLVVYLFFFLSFSLLFVCYLFFFPSFSLLFVCVTSWTALFALSGNAALPEVVFVGRSNVGKSSLVNMLVNRKALAPTSAVPGFTQVGNATVCAETLIMAFFRPLDHRTNNFSALTPPSLGSVTGPRRNARAVVIRLVASKKTTPIPSPAPSSPLLPPLPLLATASYLALQLLRGEQGQAEVSLLLPRGRARTGLCPCGRRSDGLVEEHVAAVPEG